MKGTYNPRGRSWDHSVVNAPLVSIHEKRCMYEHENHIFIVWSTKTEIEPARYCVFDELEVFSLSPDTLQTRLLCFAVINTLPQFVPFKLFAEMLILISGDEAAKQKGCRSTIISLPSPDLHVGSPFSDVQVSNQCCSHRYQVSLTRGIHFIAWTGCGALLCAWRQGGCALMATVCQDFISRCGDKRKKIVPHGLLLNAGKCPENICPPVCSSWEVWRHSDSAGRGPRTEQEGTSSGVTSPIIQSIGAVINNISQLWSSTSAIRITVLSASCRKKISWPRIRGLGNDASRVAGIRKSVIF